MNKYLQLIAMCFSIAAIISCSGDEEEMEIETAVDTSLGNLSKGQAVVSVTGSETFELENATVVASNVQATIEGKDYMILSIVMGESGSSQQLVSIGFYIPAEEGTIPSDGNVPITFQLAAEDNTYAAVSVIGAGDIYDSSTATTGTLTVSNSSPGTNSFDATFDIQNITSFSDTSVDLVGAFKF